MKKVCLVLTCLFICMTFCTCGLLDKRDENPEMLASGKVGDVLIFDGLEIQVNSFSFSSYPGGFEKLSKIEDGLQYCVINLTIKNTSAETKVIKDAWNLYYEFSLTYKNDYKYLGGTYYEYTNFLLAHDTIAPLQTLENVCICFKVPNEVAENSSERLVLDLSKNKKADLDFVEWKLR